MFTRQNIIRQGLMFLVFTLIPIVVWGEESEETRYSYLSHHGISLLTTPWVETNVGMFIMTTIGEDVNYNVFDFEGELTLLPKIFSAGISLPIERASNGGSETGIGDLRLGLKGKIVELSEINGVISLDIGFLFPTGKEELSLNSYGFSPGLLAAFESDRIGFQFAGSYGFAINEDGGNYYGSIVELGGCPYFYFLKSSTSTVSGTIELIYMGISIIIPLLMMILLQLLALFLILHRHMLKLIQIQFKIMVLV